MSKLLGGEFGLAVTYWLLFFLGASSFFIFGSQAVDQERWLLYRHRRCSTGLHFFADSGNQGGPQRATALESYVAHLFDLHDYKRAGRHLHIGFHLLTAIYILLTSCLHQQQPATRFS